MKKITLLAVALFILPIIGKSQIYEATPFRFTIDPEYGDTLYIIPQVNIKCYLSGCYVGTSGLMYDSLRAKGMLPNTSPYDNITMVNPGVFSMGGNDAIVDWVKVTLMNNDTTVYLSALVQRDGDVVDMDGVSPLYTLVERGSYKVGIKHRNHLGIELLNSVYINDTIPTLVDFTNVSTVLYNTQVIQPTRIIGGKRALYAGNCYTNTPKQYITYNGWSSSDKVFLRNNLYVNNIHTPIVGYSIFDLDMNGTATFISANNINDRMVIYVNVGANVTALIKEQTTF